MSSWEGHCREAGRRAAAPERCLVNTEAAASVVAVLASQCGNVRHERLQQLQVPGLGRLLGQSVGSPSAELPATAQSGRS